MSDKIFIKLSYVTVWTAISGVVIFVGLLYTPPSVWFEYKAVEPSKDVFKNGENLIMMSSSVIRRSVDMRWNDVLRCDFDSSVGEDFIIVSTITTEADNLKTNNDWDFGEWLYGALLPATSSTCFMESTITATIPLGIEKIQKVTSSKFRIEYEENTPTN